jgi:hypothetical protein
MQKSRKIIPIILALFLFISTCFAQEKLLDKRITLNLNDIGIADVLDTISKQTRVNFSYNSDVVPLSKKISVHARNEKIESILSRIFNNEKIKFQVVNHQIVISLAASAYNKIIDKKTDKTEGSYLIINGTVKDEKKHASLPYASVSLSGSGIGTVTNSKGEFLFKIPVQDTDKILSISYVGYKSFESKIVDIHDSNWVVFLKPISIPIPEVTVVPHDPLLIMKTALSHIDHNYDSQPVNLTAFLRETTRKNKNYISLSEAILNIYKAPYNNINITDQAKIFKGRKKQDPKVMEPTRFIVQGGIYYSLMLDIVKNMADFLSDDFIGYYKYVYGGIVDYQDRDAYVIQFDENRPAGFPLYRGEIYIDVASCAIVSANFSLCPDGIDYAEGLLIKKKPLFMRIKLVKAQYFVNYRLIGDKWTLNSVRSEIEFKIKNRHRFTSSTYSATSEMVVTRKDTTGVQHFKRAEIAKNSDVLFNQVTDSDDSFWGIYNIIRPDESIEKAIEKLPQIF